MSFIAVFGSGIRDPGWVKIRIRDKHPVSATLNNKIKRPQIWLNAEFGISRSESRIRIRTDLEMPEPDSYIMNADPQPCWDVKTL